MSDTSAPVAMPGPNLGHITLDEPNGKADCATCKTGTTVPPNFGAVSRTDLLAAFVVQHSVHTKKGIPSGLTPTGRVSKAAKTAWAATHPITEEK